MKVAMKTIQFAAIACLFVASELVASAQTPPAAYQPPEGIAFRRATIISEGSRLAAEAFCSQDKAGRPLPTIIMCHGWGGLAQQLRQDAVVFARAGYFIVLFDYRGWGPSEGRLVTAKPLERAKPGEPI